MGGFYEQLGFHLHSVTWPHLTARDAGRGGRRKRKGGGEQPADRPRTRRLRDCLRDTVRHPPADGGRWDPLGGHANLTAAPPAPRCLELRLEQRSVGSPLLPSLSKPRQQRLRRRASRPPHHPPGGGGFPCPWNQQTREETAERGAVSEMHPAPPCRRESPQSRGSRPTAEEATRERSPQSWRKIGPRLRPSPLPARPTSPQEPGSLRCSFRAALPPLGWPPAQGPGHQGDVSGRNWCSWSSVSCFRMTSERHVSETEGVHEPEQRRWGSIRGGTDPLQQLKD